MHVWLYFVVSTQTSWRICAGSLNVYFRFGLGTTDVRPTEIHYREKVTSCVDLSGSLPDSYSAVQTMSRQVLVPV
jgi:hypothetical protein